MLTTLEICFTERDMKGFRNENLMTKSMQDMFVSVHISSVGYKEHVENT